MAEIQTYTVRSFDDPRLGRERWDEILRCGTTNVVCLTWHWQKTWWETFGRGELLIVVAEKNGVPVALASLMAIDGMVYFVGSKGSDCLDFSGDVSDPDVLYAILITAREHVSGFIGFKFCFVPEYSPTGRLLEQISERLGLAHCLRDEWVTPVVDLSKNAAEVQAKLQRSLLRRENYFREQGRFDVQVETESVRIEPYLAEFFHFHQTEWETKQIESELATPPQRAFLTRVLEAMAKEGFARMLRLEWEGQFLAAEFAFYYRGTHFSAPWCYNIAFAKRCPGHVLLRQSVLAAVAAGLHTYDLGLGDQEYKFRLPVRTFLSQTWGLYRPDA